VAGFILCACLGQQLRARSPVGLVFGEPHIAATSRIASPRSCYGLCGLVISGTAAADQTCKAKATRQKLAGDALISFVKNCESDANMACAEQAVSKMLAGPASDRFIDKCVTKAMGTGPRWCVDNSDCTGGAGCDVCWAGLCGS
jgi:hypothetical protein